MLDVRRDPNGDHVLRDVFQSESRRGAQKSCAASAATTMPLQELSAGPPYPSLRVALLARKGQDDAARQELAKMRPVATNEEELSHTHHFQCYVGAAYALLGDTR